MVVAGAALVQGGVSARIEGRGLHILYQIISRCTPDQVGQLGELSVWCRMLPWGFPILRERLEV